MLRLAIALFFSAGIAQAADTFEFKNEHGPYAVGLHVRQQYDRSRAYAPAVSLVTGQPSTGERARPMQMLVWYPAAAGGGKPVTFRDYLVTRATETDFTLDAANVQRLTEMSTASNSGFPKAAQELTRPMWAVRDAKERQGKFPVAIYAPSFGAAASENVELCEYLASHGYIVIASPSQGAHTRAMTSDIEGVEAQAADIAYIISYAATLPQADLERVAVIGFSWGGLSNVVAASRDSRIKALVGMDGSVRYYPEYVNGGKDAIRGVAPERLAVPMLYFTQRPASIEALSRRGKDLSYSLLNKMVYSDVIVATMYPMNHGHFASDYVRFLPDESFSDYTRDEISAAYGWVSRYTLRFLDAYLKGDTGAAAFLANTPKANGVPSHMISLDVRKSTGAPPTRETFAAQLAARGFDQANAIYGEMQSKGTEFKLNADDINDWGYELLRKGMVKEAIAMFGFGIRLNPNDANLFDSLGEAQAVAGMRDDAIGSYRRSLELNPKNTNASVRLKALSATSSKG